MEVVYLKWRNIVSLAAACCILFVFCEFIIYYAVQIQCTWPQLSQQTTDHNILPDEHRTVKVVLLADTHLLGEVQGHWFDKLRREWQMWRAFQTAMMLHEPHSVFILGDIFDEGLWASRKQFAEYVNRFYTMFYHSIRTKMFIVVGNHDIGFHDRGRIIDLNERFETVFGESVQLIELDGNIFITINSMAMEGDGCEMCRQAMNKLDKISQTLMCSKNRAWDSASCNNLPRKPYSKPVLLLHFPLYRRSEANCTGPDVVTGDQKYMEFREQFHCLSRVATQHLLSTFEPRLVFTGHTHHGCYTEHKDGAGNMVPEHTVPSFSWRNINNPSYIMLVIRNNNYAVSKCYLPTENTVIYSYIIGFATILIWQIFKIYRHPQYTYHRTD